MIPPLKGNLKFYQHDLSIVAALFNQNIYQKKLSGKHLFFVMKITDTYKL